MRNTYRLGGQLACALATVSMLGGCTLLQAQSHADPHTIAIYAVKKPDKKHPGGNTGPDGEVTITEEAVDGPMPHYRRVVTGKLSALSRPCYLKKPTSDTHTGAIDLDCFRFPEDRLSVGKTAYERALETTTDRNRLSAILMKQSDDVCTLELGRLSANEAITNAAFSTITTSLAAAATIVTGDVAQSILAGGATATSGIRDHVNSDVFRGQISSAIAKAITLERDKAGQKIFDRRSAELAEYSIDEVIRDVNRYHQICSFYKGLELLNSAIEKQAPSRSDHVLDLQQAIIMLDSRLKEEGLSEADRATLVKKRTEFIAKLSDAVASPEAGGDGGKVGAAPPPEKTDDTATADKPTPKPVKTKAKKPAS